MADEDILASAASTTQQMLPQQQGSLTTFGPAPIVQPPPMPRPQVQPQQYGRAGNEFQTVSGRKRADRQALFSNTANLVKTGADYIQAKKQRALTMDIERLISAQQGLEEAKASGDQEAIKKNTSIINDLTSDPKKVKQFQKAFNIDLFGGGKNKNENQALMQAFKNTKQDGTQLNPVAQKLMNAQPVREQLSPEAQQQAMAIKAGLVPKAGEVLKAYEENFKTLQGAKNVTDRNAALEKAASIRAQAEMYHADKLIDAANLKVLGQQGAAEIKARTERYKANLVAATWDKRLAMIKETTKMKTGNSPVFKQLYEEGTTYNKRLKDLADENEKLQKDIDAQSVGTVGKFFGVRREDTADIKQKRIKINANNFEMQATQQNLQGLEMKMKTLDTMGMINLQSMSEGSSGGGSSDSDSGDGVTVVNDSDTE